MTGPYMGSTGDQFAGADPRELERLRRLLDSETDKHRTRNEALQARIDQLEQALREIVDPTLCPSKTACSIAHRALHPDQRGGDR